MGNYISREAAIKILRKSEALYRKLMKSQVRADMIGHCIRLIGEVPAADVVPMDFHDRCMQIEIEKRMNLVTHGKWIKVPGYASPGGDPVWACSKCGKGLHVWGIEAQSYGKDVADHQWVSCPNCGTVMEE